MCQARRQKEKQAMRLLRAVVLLFASVAILNAQVTYDRLLNAAKEPQNWLTYSGGFASQRYSTLSQITPENVKDLTLQWAFQQRSTEKIRGDAVGRRWCDVFDPGAQ